MASDTLDITLLGKAYSVTCRTEDKEDLLAAVSYLDEKLTSVAGKTHASGEKLAMMTALNIAHEFLQFQRTGGFDMQAVKRRINFVNARLGGVLAQREKLF